MCTSQMVPYKITRADNGDAWVEVCEVEELVVLPSAPYCIHSHYAI
jgi:hypothetical protein